MAVAFVGAVAVTRSSRVWSATAENSLQSFPHIRLSSRRSRHHTRLCAPQGEAVPVVSETASESNESGKGRRWLWGAGADESSGQVEPIGARASRAIWRVGWLSWWVQLVLTSVSVVILLFAFAFPGVSVTGAASAPGLVLSAMGALLALLSLIWTYTYTRISLRLCVAPDSLPLLRNLSGSLRIGSWLGFVGVAISLLAFQATVGTLLARLFTAGAAPVAGSATATAGGALVLSPGSVQAIDILVVQATANAMSSLFTGVLSTVWLQTRNEKWLLTADSRNKMS